jgi:hypothetical protein
VDCADGKGWASSPSTAHLAILDTTPLPVALTKWKYRTIYSVDDRQVGQWGAEASVNVGG